MSRRALALATAAATAIGILATTMPASAAPVPAPAASASSSSRSAADALKSARSWVYQLQNYSKGRLDTIAAAKRDVIVIDLARDANSNWFRPDEIATLRATGAVVLAYFEIGSIEDFRPELKTVRTKAPDLLANRWSEWPDETFVRYWDQRWWDLVIRPRIDQALTAGFDGVYLDTPLAYEEIAPAYTDGRTRDQLATSMVTLIARISDYGRTQRPGFLTVPQNSPELYKYPGYLPAIDALAMEELWYEATDEPCTATYCTENLKAAQAVHAAGKPVLTVDYAKNPTNITLACRQSRAAGFIPYVGPVDLNRIAPPCP